MRRNLQATEPILTFDYPNSRDAASVRMTHGRSRNGIARAECYDLDLDDWGL